MLTRELDLSRTPDAMLATTKNERAGVLVAGICLLSGARKPTSFLGTRQARDPTLREGLRVIA